MPYKVHKLINDRRNNTCGFFLPNGGFYHVLEMTFENHKQLSDIGQRPGYSVDYVDGPIGFFDVEGYEVDLGSVKVNKITKMVESYEKKTRKRGEKQVAQKREHKGTERSETEIMAQSMGLRTDVLSTQTLKEIIGRKGKQPQSTLSVNAV